MGGASAGLKRDIFNDVDLSKSFGFKYPLRSEFGVGSLTNPARQVSGPLLLNVVHTVEFLKGKMNSHKVWSRLGIKRKLCM